MWRAVAARGRSSGSTLRAPRSSVRVSSSSSSSSASPQLSLGVGAAAGGMAGVVSALTGVGGGLILIPTLARFTSLPQQAVNGTSIAAVTMSSSVGAYNHMESGACNIPLALVTTLPSVVFARYGVQAAHRLSSKRLALVVGSAMLACTPLVALKNSDLLPKFSGRSSNPMDLQFYTGTSDSASENEAHTASFVARARADPMAFVVANAKYVGAGCGAGFISGLCGLGGGILMTAYLTAVSDMPQEFIIGTSLLSIVPTAASSTYFNLRAKSLHMPTALRVGGALTVGVFVTSKFVTHHVPEDVLRAILASTLGTAALVMIRRGR